MNMVADNGWELRVRSRRPIFEHGKRVHGRRFTVEVRDAGDSAADPIGTYTDKDFTSAVFLALADAAKKGT